MEKTEIITPLPEGWRITRVWFGTDGNVHTAIEKIKEKDFEWYWGKFYIESSCNVDKQWKLVRWFVLIDFYRWFSKELNGEWKPDWESENQLKYIIYYSWDEKKYITDCYYHSDYSFGISFSEKAVQKALKILPKEFLDKLFQV
jgi:hypothetical protein